MNLIPVEIVFRRDCPSPSSSSVWTARAMSPGPGRKELPVFDDDDPETTIRSVHIVDLDDDGFNDIMATVDRPGTIKDSPVWFRNVGK